MIISVGQMPTKVLIEVLEGRGLVVVRGRYDAKKAAILQKMGNRFSEQQLTNLYNTYKK